jgi:hypothetical protein
MVMMLFNLRICHSNLDHWQWNGDVIKAKVSSSKWANQQDHRLWAATKIHRQDHGLLVNEEGQSLDELWQDTTTGPWKFAENSEKTQRFSFFRSFRNFVTWFSPLRTTCWNYQVLLPNFLKCITLIITHLAPKIMFTTDNIPKRIFRC